LADIGGFRRVPVICVVWPVAGTRETIDRSPAPAVRVINARQAGESIMSAVNQDQDVFSGGRFIFTKHFFLADPL
jgi:hypothetical protein